MKKSCTLAAFAATGLLTMVGMAGKASAQCSNYTITQSSGAAIIPGTTDSGSHADDVVTPIALPFAVNIYGANYTVANASSNGNIQFGGTDTNWTNACISGGNANGFPGATIYSMWDDQRTDGTGNGIFKATYGTAPNRSFVIEWRTGYFSGCTGTANYEVVLYEGHTYFDVIYGSLGPCNGSSATTGVKANNTATAAVTQFSCNTNTLATGMQLRFDCPPPTSPTIIPNAMAGYPGGTSLVSAAVGAAAGHPITSVTAQMNSINGSPLTIALFDDGSHGDAVAGDGTYSNTYTVSGSTAYGSYTIPMTVTDNQPVSTSANGSFNVSAQGDDCSTAIAAVLGSNAFDSTNPAAVTTSLPAATCGTMGADLWYTFSSPTGGNVTISTCGLTGSDSAIAVYTNCTTSLACNDDSCGLQSSLCFAANPGQTYLLRIGGYNATRWAGSFNIAMVSPAGPYTNPSPATPEGEACGINNPDTVDGGCNSAPAVYIAMQTCTNYTGSVASSTSFRDTDWYQFTTTGDTFNLTGQAQFAAYVFVIGEPCPGTVAAGPFSNSVSGGCVADYNFSASVTLGAGTYDIVVVPQLFDGLTVCGSNEQYWFNLSPASGCGLDVCCRNDYNGDGDIGTDADIESFFACLGGNCCATCPGDADFNCDGDIGTDADIESFFRVLAGGHC